MPHLPSGNATIDDRCPFEAAVAVVDVVARLSGRFADGYAVFDAILEQQGPESRRYIQAVARAGHSVYYEQLQRLYLFAQETVGPSLAPRLCLEAGREFASAFFADNLRAVLALSLGDGAPFRSRLRRMLRSYLLRYTGERYTLRVTTERDGLAFSLRYAEPAAVRAYLEHHGLDPAASFRNSASFVAGAIDGFASRLIHGYDGRDFLLDASREPARFLVPVRDGDRLDHDPILAILLRSIEDLEARRRTAVADERLESDLIAGSAAMRAAWDLTRRASRSREIVLLRGESGTGKSVLAKKIHELSDRARGPFVEVALTSDVGSDQFVQSDLFGHERGAFTGAVGSKKGLFALADGGTIFLDEVGDASRDVQARLLRVVETSRFRRLGGEQDQQVDVRIIAATNRDLESMAADGTFRRDLYYRLNVIPIVLPPLRDRPEDLPALAGFLLARIRSSGGPARRLAAGVAERLGAYTWPGNVRELDHALRYAAVVAAGEEIGLADLPPAVRDAISASRAPQRQVAPQTDSAALVDEERLRRAIRGADLRGRAGRAASEAHIDHARRVWMGVLIDELGGDLCLVGRFWDRSSEKSVRAAVRALGLTERLAVARARARH